MTPDRLIEFLDSITAARPRRSKERDHQSVATAPRTKRGHSGPPPVDRKMLLTKDAAAYVGLAQQTLAKLRWSGESPPYFKVGRQVVYDRDDLDAWLARRRRSSTSDAGSNA